MPTPALDKVEQAFLAALAAREAGAPVDVARLCGGDAALAAEVDSLLRHLNEAGPDERADTGADGAGASETRGMAPFLNPAELHSDRQRGGAGGAGGGDAGRLGEWGVSAVGQRVGGFTLIGELGAGGMGVVFVASQDNPRRMVAVKVIRRTAATPTMVRRFEREAQLLGRLNHPGIAQVYAAGVAEMDAGAGDERVRAPYIAMELVEGPSILDYVRTQGEREGPPRAAGPR